MFELIKLRYKLNKEYFFSSSILLKDISELHKNLFFAFYSILKTIFIITLFLFIEILVLKSDTKSYFFNIGQLLFFLACTFYYRYISDYENNKTHIKDFLVSNYFNYGEKIRNKKNWQDYFFLNLVY